MNVLCRVIGRDQEYRDLNIDFTMDVAKRAIYINLFPVFLHPCVLTHLRPVCSRAGSVAYGRAGDRFIGPLLSKTKAYQRRMRRLVGDMIEERRDKLAMDRDYEGKPACFRQTFFLYVYPDHVRWDYRMII